MARPLAGTGGAGGLGPTDAGLHIGLDRLGVEAISALQHRRACLAIPAAKLRQIHAAGLVIRDLPLLVSNFRSQGSLDAYLCDRNVVGIADLDTRRLTRILREQGAQNGCIMAGDVPPFWKKKKKRISPGAGSSW